MRTNNTIEETLELDKVIRVEGYKTLLQVCGCECFAGLPSYNMEIDFGMRRVLKVKCLTAFLILAGAGEIKKIELESPKTNLRTLLIGQGYKPELKADYRKYRDAWKHAIGCDCFNYAITGIFTEHGYAIQRKLWADCWEHTVEAGIVTPGWIKIDGRNITGVGADLVASDVFQHFGDRLIRALEEPVDITGDQLQKYLKDAGLEDVIPHIRLIEE